jgi:hypothetical protein
MRKRSNYRPKPILLDPLGFVLESSAPISEAHKGYVLSWKIRNTSAFGSLLRGEATKDEMNCLVAARNIVEALLVICGIDKDDGTLARSACALIEICDRYNKGVKALKAPEIQALRDMMSLHDELMDVVTLAQFERALAYAKKEIRAGKAQALKEVK